MTERQESLISDDLFADLYAQFHTKLVGYAYGYTNDSYASEDVVAEAFLSVLAMVRRGAGPTQETFLSYMRVCIRNEAVNRGRANGREMPVEAIEDLVDQTEQAQPADALDGGEDEDAALRAFATLPNRAQQLLWRLEVKGEKLAAVAEANNQSVGTTATAAFRAREVLRQSYLIERAAVDSCSGLPIRYLAQYALNTAPQKRSSRVETHLQTCERCSATLRRMRGFALSTSAILVLAGSGALMRDLVWGADTAAHAADGFAEGSAGSHREPLKAHARDSVARRGLSKTARRVLVGGAGFGCLVIIALLLFLQQNQESSPQNAGQSSSKGGVANIAQAGSKSGKEPGDPDPAPPTREQQRDTSSKPETELPDGVRSLVWQEPVWSGRGADAQGTLLVTVVFDRETSADDYEVILTPRTNTTVLQASAGCELGQSNIVCTPDKSFQGLDKYNWKLIVKGDAAGFAGLPEATILPTRG